MNTTAQQQPPIDLDAEVRRYVEIGEAIDTLNVERAGVLARIRALGPGEHVTSYGMKATVSAPSRSFNVDRAWSMLSPEQQALCVSPDAKKIKAQLPPVLLDECMDEGKGDPRVTVR